MNTLNLYNGVKIPVIGIGTSQLHYEVLNSIIPEAVKASNGCLLIDTASLYRNESEIGRVIKEQSIDRSSLFLASKVEPLTIQGRKRFFFLNSRKIKSTLASSLKALQTDYLDLYYFHSFSFVNEDKLRNAYHQMIDIYDSGKIKSFGICNITIDKLKWLKNNHLALPMVVQVEVNPYFSNRDLVDFCHDNNIIVQVHTQFGKGNAELLNDAVLTKIAKDHESSSAEIILAWLYAKGITSIPRTSKASRIAKNLNASNIDLSISEIESIDNLNKDKSLHIPCRDDER